MNLDLPINFENVNFNIITICFGIYLILIGVLYYIIFHKHHKRNKIELSELVTLVTKFYSLFMLSTIIILAGFAVIIQANDYKDTRSDVISMVLFGIILISLTIINFIFYIKRNLVDPDPVLRREIKRRVIQVGEILELIFFVLFMFMPLWRIPHFISIFDDKKTLIIDIGKSFFICIASIILLISINPLNIKERITKNKIYKGEISNNKNDDNADKKDDKE